MVVGEAEGAVRMVAARMGEAQGQRVLLAADESGLGYLRNGKDSQEMGHIEIFR